MSQTGNRTSWWGKNDGKCRSHFDESVAVGGNAIHSLPIIRDRNDLGAAGAADWSGSGGSLSSLAPGWLGGGVAALGVGLTRFEVDVSRAVAGAVEADFPRGAAGFEGVFASGKLGRPARPTVGSSDPDPSSWPRLSSVAGIELLFAAFAGVAVVSDGALAVFVAGALVLLAAVVALAGFF